MVRAPGRVNARRSPPPAGRQRGHRGARWRRRPGARCTALHPRAAPAPPGTRQRPRPRPRSSDVSGRAARPQPRSSQAPSAVFGRGECAGERGRRQRELARRRWPLPTRRAATPTPRRPIARTRSRAASSSQPVPRDRPAQDHEERTPGGLAAGRWEAGVEPAHRPTDSQRRTEHPQEETTEGDGAGGEHRGNDSRQPEDGPGGEPRRGRGGRTPAAAPGSAG